MEEDIFKKQYKDTIQLDEDITLFEANTPDGRTKEYKDWLLKINYLYQKYNKMVNFKCYKMLK